jgi:hypothetical protein
VRRGLLEEMPKNAVVAEIGVWAGDFSQRILDICAPRVLHLVDPWAYQPEFRNTAFGRRKNRDRMEDLYREVTKRFAGDSRVRIHRGASDEILETFEDALLDWVYIAGNHNEPFISNDLRLCLRKVKPDGIIAGDDLNWQSEKSGAPVRHAVEAVVAELGEAARLEISANQYRIHLSRNGAGVLGRPDVPD